MMLWLTDWWRKKLLPSSSVFEILVLHFLTIRPSSNSSSVHSLLSVPLLFWWISLSRLSISPCRTDIWSSTILNSTQISPHLGSAPSSPPSPPKKGLKPPSPPKGILSPSSLPPKNENGLNSPPGNASSCSPSSCPKKGKPEKEGLCTTMTRTPDGKSPSPPNGNIPSPSPSDLTGPPSTST